MVGITLFLAFLFHLDSNTHFIMAQIAPELDDLELEGASFLSSQQSSNTVPMIGKKAANPASHTTKPLSSLPNFLQPYLLKFLDLGLRGRESYPEIGKRDARPSQVHLDATLPHWLRKDLARLGKRGSPSFSIPDHWRKKTFDKPSLSKLRNGIFGERNKRSQANMNLQWFRFYGDGMRNPLRRATFQKRSEEGPHVQDFNSVPFMGKRSEERGDAVVRSGEIMVRRPRYPGFYDHEENTEEEVAEFNPWSMLDRESMEDSRRVI